jgi:hypothetical protein
MTAASYTSRAFAPSGRRTVRWQRALALLGICLPVPICAASGLTLPLPAIVERIAVSLVPWADARTMSANEALRAGVSGTILADPGERTRSAIEPSATSTSVAPRRRTSDGTSVVIPRPGDPYAWPESRDEPIPATPAPGVPGPAAPTRTTDPAVRAEPPSGTGGVPVESPTSSNPVPAPSDPAPTTPDPAPTTPDPVVQPIVEDVLAPVQPVVEVLEPVAPVAPIVEDTVKIVDETIEPVTGLLPGLGK